MRAWLYYRLSRDEDKELNSLTNQKNILVEYAENNGYTVVGESFDDNVSGMHFNREGIEKIYDEVEKKTIDAVIVKDLSRLGRHKTQTALFIDYLREHDVRVLSVTENIDTSNEDDELMVGFKGIFNDMYCRDISKKIRAGYKQKQKQGIVLIPPMGYFKDKNTGEVVIVEEQASIVRRIFDLYLSGYGIKAIAKILNAEGIKSQGYDNHVKVALVAVFYHPLEFRTIICFCGQCAVNIGIDNGHLIVFGKFHTFAELTVYAFLTLIIRRITSVNNSFHFVLSSINCLSIFFSFALAGDVGSKQNSIKSLMLASEGKEGSSFSYRCPLGSSVLPKI